MMQPLVFDEREVARRRVGGVTGCRTFDAAEDRHPSLAVRAEAVPVKQLAFPRREVALAHGVVVGIADRAGRGADAGVLAAAAESQRGMSRALIAMVDDVQGDLRDPRSLWLPDTRRCPCRRVRLHRAVLQRRSQALDHRLHQPGRVRKEGGISLTDCPQSRQQANGIRC